MTGNKDYDIPICNLLFRSIEHDTDCGKFTFAAVCRFSLGGFAGILFSRHAVSIGGGFYRIYSALITFVVATVILIVVILCIPSDRVHIPLIFSLDRPWWSWLGGIIGGIFVTGYAFFADKVSIGVLLVTSICGMLAMSLCIDKYGWLGAVKREIGIRQYVGLILIAAGVVILRLF